MPGGGTLLPLKILSLVLETVYAVTNLRIPIGDEFCHLLLLSVWSPIVHLRDNLFISLDLVDSPSTNIEDLRGLILYFHAGV